MAAHKTPLADAGIRHRKHARFHRIRRADGTSERRLLNGRCEPRPVSYRAGEPIDDGGERSVQGVQHRGVG